MGAGPTGRHCRPAGGGAQLSHRKWFRKGFHPLFNVTFSRFESLLNQVFPPEETGSDKHSDKTLSSNQLNFINTASVTVTFTSGFPDLFLFLKCFLFRPLPVVMKMMMMTMGGSLCLRCSRHSFSHIFVRHLCFRSEVHKRRRGQIRLSPYWLSAVS